MIIFIGLFCIGIFIYKYYHKKSICLISSVSELLIMASTPSVSQRYKKYSTRQHVLSKSGMYIGSCRRITGDMWLIDDENTASVKSVHVTPGAVKLVSELIDNARDVSATLKQGVASILRASATLIASLRCTITSAPNAAKACTRL